MFTNSGDLYLIDFEQVSLLPLSFMTYATIQQWPACQAVAQRLDLPQGNLPGMRTACGYFVMSTPYLGEWQPPPFPLERQLTILSRASLRLRRRGRVVSSSASQKNCKKGTQAYVYIIAKKNRANLNHYVQGPAPDLDELYHRLCTMISSLCLILLHDLANLNPNYKVYKEESHYCSKGEENKTKLKRQAHQKNAHRSH